MFGCYLLYSSQGKSGHKKEEKEIERSDGSGCLVRGQQILRKKKEWREFKRVLTNLKEFKKSKAKAARLCGVGEEKNYNEHLKI